MVTSIKITSYNISPLATSKQKKLLSKKIAIGLELDIDSSGLDCSINDLNFSLTTISPLIHLKPNMHEK